MNKQIAIVTGASAGLGREFALQISDKYKLDEIWLVARREDKLREVAQQITQATPVIITTDLSNQSGIDLIVEKLKTEQPEIKLLVNNAGFGKFGKFAEMPIAMQQEMVNLNVSAVMQLSHAALKYMQSGAKIINLASTAGFIPITNFNVYSASKAFVLHFTIALNAEIRDRGVSALAVCPGAVETEFYEVATNRPKAQWRGADPKEVVKLALRDAGYKSISTYGWNKRLMIGLAKFVPKSLIARFTK